MRKGVCMIFSRGDVDREDSKVAGNSACGNAVDHMVMVFVAGVILGKGVNDSFVITMDYNLSA
jgi:hypothetical protein